MVPISLISRIERLRWPGGSIDCTHWCYSPLLWDSLLDPFYRMVVDSREL